MSPSTRAGLRTALVVVLPAVVLGVLGADGWRLHPAPVRALGASQSPWALLPFAVGWWCGAGRVRRGVVLGGAVGLVAITSYYVYEALAYSLHAATSQLSKSHGAFWVAGAVVAGAVGGLLGALASQRAPHDHPGRFVPALAVAVAAVGPAAEALLVLRFPGTTFDPAASAAAAWTLGVLALVVLAVGVRRCGVALVAAALPLAVVLGVAGFAALVWAERHFAYVTL